MQPFGHNTTVLPVLWSTKMQSQLATLQKSLTKKVKPASPSNEMSDPWAVSSSDKQMDDDLSAAFKDDQQDESAKIVAEDSDNDDDDISMAMAFKDEDEMEQNVVTQKVTQGKQNLKNEETNLRKKIEIEQQKIKTLEAKKKMDEERDKNSREFVKPELMLTKGGRVFKQPALSRDESGSPVFPVGKDASTLSTEKSKRVEKDTPSKSWNAKSIQDLGTRSFQDMMSANVTSFPDTFSPDASLISVFAPKSKRQVPPHFAAGPAAPHHAPSQDDGDGVLSRLEQFQKELTQKGVVSPPKPVQVQAKFRAISPDRPLCEDVPVYTEKEYRLRSQKDAVKRLPPKFFIQTTYLPNRRCPVKGCPTSRAFSSEHLFLEHWNMFHKPTVTKCFCFRCSAYFCDPKELQAHLMKLHKVTDPHTAAKMAAEARVKVIPNPSFRDPWRYLGPPV